MDLENEILEMRNKPKFDWDAFWAKKFIQDNLCMMKYHARKFNECKQELEQNKKFLQEHRCVV